MLERYLSEIAGVEIDGRWLRRRAPEPAVTLTAHETMLVDLLDRAGGEADVRALRAAAAMREVPAETVEALLRDSPLFLRRTRLRMRLVGRVRSSTRAPSRRSSPAARVTSATGSE